MALQLYPDALEICSKTPPRHSAFSARAGRDARQLDEREAAGSIMAGGVLVRHVVRPAVAYSARRHPRRRCALALAPDRQPRERAGQCVGRHYLQAARQTQTAHRGTSGKTKT